MHSNRKKVDYQNEIDLLIELRKKKFNRDVESELEKSIKLNNNSSLGDLKQNYLHRQNLISKEFLKYYVQGNICDIVNTFKGKYENVFSKFNEVDLNNQLEEILMHTFERRIRAGVINTYMQEHYKEYLDYFNGNKLKAKLFAVIKWGEDENKHKNWLKDYLSSEFEDFRKNPSIFRELKGSERKIVTEIVPKNLDDYSGEIGGKTIKLTSYSNLYLEFNLTQAYEVLKKTDDPKLLADLRASFLKTIIARRYIFKEAIDKIIDYNNTLSGIILPEGISLNNKFRMREYATFFHSSEELLYESYAKIKANLEDFSKKLN